MSKRDDPNAIPEAYPSLQYSKGMGKCQNCKLTRPHKELVKETVGGVVVIHCRDMEDCTKMKDLREQSEKALDSVRPLPVPEEREIVRNPTFINSDIPFMV